MEKSEIILTKCNYKYVLHGVAGSIIATFIFFILLVITNLIAFLIGMIIFGIITILSLGFVLFIYFRANDLVGSLPNQQFPVTLDIHQTDHDAFIMVQSFGSTHDTQGLDLLIPFFKEHNYPFKIYHCFSPQEFEEILLNEHAKYIWIFGHGWRGGITFKWKRSIREMILFRKKATTFTYSKLLQEDRSPIPLKKFIAQLHCNHIFGPQNENIPLPQIIMSPESSVDDYFVSDTTTNSFCVWITVRKLIKKVSRTPI